MAPRFDPLMPEDPRRIGVYEVVGRLGSGGQSVVYLGRVAGGPPVAIKVLRAGDLEARKALDKELTAARRVAAFCTARVLDAGADGADRYIVTEYIEGPTLLEIGPQAGADLHRLAIGTITALTAIHRAGIVHRDFKPANVLISTDGPRVIDFGISRVVGASSTSGVVGTPAYMAPEQLAGGEIGPAADVFAWAVAMVFAATGRPAFGNDSIPQVMHRILHEEPTLGHLPEPLRALVASCLLKDAAARPSSRDILLRLLDHADVPETEAALAEGATVAATMNLPPLTLRTPARRRLLPLLAGGGGVAAVVAVIVIATQVMGTPHKKKPPASSAKPSSTVPAATLADQVQAAVAAKKAADFTYVNTKNGKTQFQGSGNFVLRKAALPDYDMRVGCNGDVGFPTYVIGKYGYARDATTGWYKFPATEFKNGALTGAAGCEYIYGRTVRWATTPDNYKILLRNATITGQQHTNGRTTITGTLATDKVAESNLAAPYYRLYRTPSPTLQFTMLINDDHLPYQLKLTFPTDQTTATTTYTLWRSTGSIPTPKLGTH